MSAVVLIRDAGASTPLSRLPRLRLALLVAVSAIASACAESTSTVTTGPSPAKCEVALTGTSTVEPAGGGAFITVTTQPECLWTASTTSTWITGLTPTSGQGSGRIDYRVTPNAASTMREGEVAVNDARLRLTQQPSPSSCTFTLAPPTQTIAAAGGSGNVNVTTANGCVWSATSSVAWLTLTTPVGGSASGTISFTAATNTGAERSATITVAGQQATVRQSGNQSNCQYDIAPAGQSFASAGGAGGPITVTTSAACTWTARTSETWITVTGGASGTGSGTVNFTVATNTGAARTGTISIASETFTVSQQPAPGQTACTYTIAPTGQTIAAAGGAGNPVTVTTQAPCSWAAGSNVSWISLTSSATGSGNGSVTFTVAANTVTAERAGTLTIAGETFTVTQAAAPCSYAISPTSQSIAAAGGAGTPVTVTAGAGCAWTAGSNANWITIASGGAGSGNGPVTFTVTANTAISERSGTLTIAGQPFTVNQAGLACTYSLSRQTVNAGSGGESGLTTHVTAPAGCPWTAASNVSWTVITGGSSGSGEGDVTFYVETNLSTDGRSGTMTIAGQTLTITQEAACGFAINPVTANVPATASPNVTVTVTPTRANCNWGAASNAPWLTITGGATGTGPGTVAYSVAANTGAARQGTMTVANQTFTVNQASVACVFSINPTSANQPAGATSNQTVAVTANLPTCAWTATSGAPWLTIAVASGTGNGTATYNVAANPSATLRSGTLTIAGQTFTVSQAAAACAISLAPTSANVPGIGGSGTFAVTANGPQCGWTATSLNVPWLTITGASSGTGNGSITYNVVRNAPTARVGTITVNLTGSTVGGQNFVVNQAAGPPGP